MDNQNHIVELYTDETNEKPQFFLTDTTNDNSILSKLLISLPQANEKKTEAENQTNENTEIKTENAAADDSAATESAANDTSVAATS